LARWNNKCTGTASKIAEVLRVSSVVLNRDGLDARILGISIIQILRVSAKDFKGAGGHFIPRINKIISALVIRMSAPFIILPAANTGGPRRKPDNKMPELTVVPKAAPLPRPTFALTPLAGAVPKFRGVIGMPAVQPKGHLNTLPYIG
jgi:hypothetical protein